MNEDISEYQGKSRYAPKESNSTPDFEGPAGKSKKVQKRQFIKENKESVKSSKYKRNANYSIHDEGTLENSRMSSKSQLKMNRN